MAQDAPVAPHRVLVTGAAGAVGKPVCRALVAAGHFVRGLDLRPPIGCSEAVIGSAGDVAVLADAMREIDTVIHLAAEPNDCDFVSRLIPSNFVAPYLVLDAARQAGARRAILASSIQVLGRQWRTRKLIRVSDGTSPTNGYGLSKVYVEHLGRMYHEKHGLEIVCARIGWLPRTREEHANVGKGHSVYLSHDDAGRFFRAAVECPAVGYAVAFVTSISPPGEEAVDLTEARALGYAPQDSGPAGCHFEQ